MANAGTGEPRPAGAEDGPRDFRSACRLARPYVGRDLRLSFGPDAEERPWPRLAPSWKSSGEQMVETRNKIEALPEEAGPGHRRRVSGRQARRAGYSARARRRGTPFGWQSAHFTM